MPHYKCTQVEFLCSEMFQGMQKKAMKPCLVAHGASSLENNKKNTYMYHLVPSGVFQNQPNPPLFPQKYPHQQGTGASLWASRAVLNCTGVTKLSFPLCIPVPVYANYVNVIFNSSCDKIYTGMSKRACRVAGDPSFACSYSVAAGGNPVLPSRRHRGELLQTVISLPAEKCSLINK